MGRITTTSLVLLSGLLMALPAKPAAAQCTPGAAFCADVQIGATIGGTVSIGATPPPRNNQVVVIETQPAPTSSGGVCATGAPTAASAPGCGGATGTPRLR